MTKPTRPIIAIDGPAGSGKSTLARQLAARLKLKYLDSGSLYRAAAFKAMEVGLSFSNTRRLPEVLATTRVELQSQGRFFRVILDGTDVTKRIRTPALALAASQIATNAKVRTILTGWQRRLARGGGVVAEGRDIGTVVFPKADLKFFVTASLEERAHRRLEELKQQGGRVDFHQLLMDIRKRDIRDRQRKASPLKKARGAHVIDTTGLSVGQILATMLRMIAVIFPSRKLNF